MTNRAAEINHRSDPSIDAGPHSRYSVLDKVVPGYYHRLEADGGLCGSAFGANNAPEHAMMERLVLDDLAHWAAQYKARPLAGSIKSSSSSLSPAAVLPFPPPGSWPQQPPGLRLACIEVVEASHIRQCGGCWCRGSSNTRR